MAGSFGKPTMSALVANIKRPDGACSGRVEIKGVRGARETSRTQGSVFKDSGEAHSPECWGGAGRRAQSLTLDPRGPTPQPEGPQVGPDTLARDMLDVIIFIHFLFLKIRVNIQYIVSLYILYIGTAGLRKSPSTTWRQLSMLTLGERERRVRDAKSRLFIIKQQ